MPKKPDNGYKTGLTHYECYFGEKKKDTDVSIKEKKTMKEIKVLCLGSTVNGRYKNIING